MPETPSSVAIRARLATGQRAERDRGPIRVPIRLAESGLVVIDATWGTIRPMQLAEGVRTVGEQEVLEHLERGLVLIDSRPAEAYGCATIPAALNIPHDQVVERISELDPAAPTGRARHGGCARRTVP